MADDLADPFDLGAWPPPPPKPTPKTEHLWTLFKADERVDCQLRYHGEWGVEVQTFRNQQFFAGRRFDTRAAALQWAGFERAEWQKNGFTAAVS